MSILVTGSLGLIGSSVMSVIDLGDNHVVGVTRTKIPNATHRYLVADLLDNAALKNFDQVSPALIIHCAAVIPSHTLNETESIATMNSIMDKNIVTYCQQNAIRLIYLSSTAVYGSAVPAWSETTPVSPINAYAKAKYYSECDIQEKLQENAVILRLSAPYGYKQRTNTVLRIFIERAVRGLDLFYDGSGKRQQDFTAVEDIAVAIKQFITHDKLSGIFNVASGNPIQMHELAMLVKQVVGISSIQVLPSRKLDLQEDYRGIVDIKKIQTLLNWQPITELAVGIRHWVNNLRVNV